MPRDAARRVHLAQRAARRDPARLRFGVEAVVVVAWSPPHAQVVGALEHDAVERAVREEEALERGGSGCAGKTPSRSSASSRRRSGSLSLRQ